MNGRDLTLGVVGALAVGAALGRRGSRAWMRWRGKGPVDEEVYHYTRSHSLQPGFGRGVHWGTERAAEDRRSTTGAKGGQMIRARVQLQNPFWTGEICQWLDPGCVLWNLTDNLDTMRDMAERVGVAWPKHTPDLEEARAIMERVDALLSSRDLYASDPNLYGSVWGFIWNELERQGYDGVAYQNNTEDAGSTSYITFHPRQVQVLDHRVVPGWKWRL